MNYKKKYNCNLLQHSQVHQITWQTWSLKYYFNLSGKISAMLPFLHNNILPYNRIVYTTVYGITRFQPHGQMNLYSYYKIQE